VRPRVRCWTWIPPPEVRSPPPETPRALDGPGTSITRRRAPWFRSSRCCWQLGFVPCSRFHAYDATFLLRTPSKLFRARGEQ